MSKHTPGPWSVDWEASNLFSDYSARAWINADGMHIGYVDGPNSAERTANASLIAAAPDLLTALRVVLRDHMAVHGEGDLEMQPALFQARAAIARATGKTE